MSNPTVNSSRRQYDRTNLAAARIVLGPPEHPCTGLVLWAHEFMARLERELAKAKARRVVERLTRGTATTMIPPQGFGIGIDDRGRVAVDHTEDTIDAEKAPFCARNGQMGIL